MGGSITVTSREGEGTCFRVALPIAPALEQAA
jgi:signal transduction histidine kinase